MTKQTKTRSIGLIALVLIGSLLLSSCNTSSTDAAQSAPSATNPTQNSSAIAQSENKTMSKLPKLEGTAKVQLTVKGSPIIIEVNGTDAPVTAGNFIDLVEKGVYDGLVFHRVIKSPQPFVAQGGDPQGKDPKFPVEQLGTGGYIDSATGQRRFIPLEIKLEGEDEPIYSKAMGRQAGLSAPPVLLKHDRGSIAMARSQAPDSASSQFYISLADLEFLDGDYAVFGKVIQGMEAVDAINQGDRIETAKVIEGADLLKK
jgi:peptidyl-prolyl cis-trans isomerase B (cyclophilin B)